MSGAISGSRPDDRSASAVDYGKDAATQLEDLAGGHHEDPEDHANPLHDATGSWALERPPRSPLVRSEEAQRLAKMVATAPSDKLLGEEAERQNHLVEAAAPSDKGPGLAHRLGYAPTESNARSK